MLRGIRTASTNWLGRTIMGAVMGLLAASFAIWGINDIFKGFGRSTVAKVGGTEIPIEQFRRTYNDRLQQLSRQIGRPIAPEQAKALGIDRSVLLGMIADAGLDQRARQMRLALPDDEIVRRITEDPAFRSATGKFDRGRFEQFLRGVGLSEQRVIAEQRQLMLRRQIVESIDGNVPVPKAWLEVVNEFQNQERSIEYVTFGAAQAGDIPAPTAEELSKYFEARKILFRAPEYRKIEVVAVTPEELGRWMEISEADIKTAFDEHRSHYVTPERRHVEQIVFPTMPDAEAAEARIKDGLSFATLAAERGLKDTDIDLGTVTKAEIIDPAVANAAFALKDGEVSAPIQGRFGAVLATVLKIEPEEAKTLAEVTPQIRKDIVTERARAEVRSLHEKIEDERAGGATLAQAAEKLKLPVLTFDVDRSGRDPGGKVVNFPHAGSVVPAAFNSDVAVDNDPLEADGGYVWYNVAGITPSRDRTLDEVKDQVEARWRTDEIASRLKTKSADLLDKLKAGTPFDSVASAVGLKVQTADKLKRGKPGGGVSPAVVTAVFRTAKDAFGSAEGDQPTDWIVFRVTDITTPKFDAASADAKRIEDVLKRQESEEIFEQYMTWLRNDLGTSVNQAALTQALGNGAPDTN
ncbi:MAG: SurA N-terminal domain-containing protein [Xanthobacteraceae bacterium]